MSCGRSVLGGLLGIGMLLCAGSAGADGVTSLQALVPPITASTSSAGETLKERLSDKASDDQRVDNCNVPVDRRGPKIRPDACSDALLRTEASRSPDAAAP